MRSKAGKRGLALLFSTVTAVVPLVAGANGRFPRAERLVESAGKPDELTLAATYGLITTKDRGKHWYQICESSFSLQDAYAGDPLLDVTSDGTMLVAVQSTFNVSRDGGCQWTPVLGTTSESVPDFTVTKDASRTIVAAVTLKQDGGTVNRLKQSTDGGATWSLLGAPIPMPAVYTVDVAPSDSSHIYVSGLSAANTGVFATSIDRGGTWTTYDIPNTNADEIPYIAAVHPTDPQRIFVRTDAWTNRDVIDTANDALLYSEDMGKTWRELFRAGAKLLGFALSPSGAAVLIGYGDPVESAQSIDSSAFGIYKSSTVSFSFEQVFANAVTCLAWTTTGIYVCGSGQTNGAFELAFAPEASFLGDAGTLMPLLRRTDIKAPLACCPGTTGAVCATDWATACQTFDTCSEGGTPDLGAPPATCSVDAGTSEAGKDGGGNGGAGGAPDASAGTGGSGLATDAGNEAGSPEASEQAPAADSGATSGCGCRLGGEPVSQSTGWGAVLLASLSLVRRRRERRASQRAQSLARPSFAS